MRLLDDLDEDWQTAVSHSEVLGLIAVIFANPVMIDAYRAGVPGNGKPFTGAPSRVRGTRQRDL